MVEMGGNVNISERKYLAVYSDVANKDIVIQENINKHGKKIFSGKPVECNMHPEIHSN